MSKKLLSVLVVLALALSMVPVVGLPATKAEAATTVSNDDLHDEYGNLSDGMQAVCPHCAAKGDDELKTWTDVVSASGKRIGSQSGKLHYYLSDNLDAHKNAQFLYITGGDTEICFHLNGKNLSYGGRMVVGTDSTFNVMGDGTLTFLASCTTNVAYNNAAIWGTGTTNLYGGTWNIAEGKTAPVFAPNSKDAVLNVFGTTTINGVVSLLALKPTISLKDGWSGTIKEYDWGTASGVIVSSSGWIHADCLSGDGEITGTIENLATVQNANTTQGTRFAPKAVIIKSGESVVGYNSATAAAEDYTDTDITDGKVIKIFADTNLVLNNGDYYVDACGKDVVVTGTGTLYPIDSANDNYDQTKCGNWTILDGVLVNDVTYGGNRYLTIEEDDVYTTHRIMVEVSEVSLKTSAAGIYFKAVFYGDATIASRIESYGVAVSKDGMPNSLDGVCYSELTDKSGHNGKYFGGNSAAIIDILKATDDLGDGETNLDRARTDIYGKAYIKIDMDGDSNTPADLVMGTREYVKCSLESVLGAIDDAWDGDTYTSEQKENVESFLNAWYAEDETITADSLGLTKIGA